MPTILWNNGVIDSTLDRVAEKIKKVKKENRKGN